MTAIKRQATHIAVTIIIIVIGMTAAVLVATQTAQPPPFALELIIFLAGTVGGVANNYRRLLALPLKVIADKSVITKQLITFQIYISPVVGGIFASVLYLLFMSGVLQGTFFPAFSPAMQASYVSFDAFSQGADPATNQDVAKAILWAFAAGFSEGLVPNFIDKIAKATELEKKEAEEKAAE